MSQEKIKRIRDAVSAHPDYPIPGILFRNIFPVLRDPSLFKNLIDVMVESVRTNAAGVQLIVGLDARGFLFGPMIAQAMGIGFAPIRKAGKLPGETYSITYQLEYGTMKAACDLVCKAGGEVLQCLVIMEMTDLRGRDKVSKTLTSLIKLSDQPSTQK